MRFSIKVVGLKLHYTYNKKQRQVKDNKKPPILIDGCG